MKSVTKAIAASSLMATLLVGCGGGGAYMPQPNTQTGAIAGSVLGGVIGHQFGKGDGKDAATILGAVVGGLIGGNIGAQLDAQDRSYIANSLASGQPQQWQNQNTGYNYTVKPGQVYQSNYQNQQTVCRPAMIEAVINGRVEQVQMKACRGANGQWQSAS